MQRVTLNIPSVAALSEAVKIVVASGKQKILLFGDMGAGKTTFTRAFCAHLQCVDEANSPTFAIINQYRYPLTLDINPENERYGLIHHIDLYRLRSLQEALDIGIEDYLFDNQYCLIEWGQLIAPLLENEDFLTVTITAVDENNRIISIF